MEGVDEQHGIERVGLEARIVRETAAHVDVRCVRETGRELCERVGVDVDGDHAPRRADRGSEAFGEVTAAGADVGEGSAGRNVEEREYAHRLLQQYSVPGATEAEASLRDEVATFSRLKGFLSPPPPAGVGRVGERGEIASGERGGKTAARATSRT